MVFLFASWDAFNKNFYKIFSVWNDLAEIMIIHLNKNNLIKMSMTENERQEAFQQTWSTLLRTWSFKKTLNILDSKNKYISMNSMNFEYDSYYS